MLNIKKLISHFIPLFKILNSFNKRKKIQLLSLIPIFIIQAIIELISIGSLIPFVTSMTNPDIIFNFLKPYTKVKQIFSISNPSDILYPSFLIFVSLIIITGILKLFTSYLILRFTFTAGSELSISIFKKNIYQYYDFFLKRNSNELINLVFIKSSRTIGSLISVMQIINNIILLLFVLVGFTYISPRITISIFLIVSLSYVFVLLVFKNILNKNSKIISSTENNIVESTRNVFTQIRDVILNKNHSYFIKNFSSNIIFYNLSLVSVNFLATSPKIIIETIGLSILTVLIYFLINDGQSLIDLLPYFAVLALAVQRLLPLFQQLYYNFAHIESDYATLLEVAENCELKSKEKEISNLGNLFFNFNKIKFEHINYSLSNKEILNDINVTIKKGQKIGIVGHTGSGKSTFIDLFLGLRFPTSGHIKIDDTNLNYQNTNDWQKKISQVSQSFNLLNKSVLENIIFGSERNENNINKIQNLINKLELIKKINSLKNGIDENVGENGILLSGGEKQKIALARALFKEFEILVLDEATSSLDNETEEIIMREIFKLENKTILIIAHRLSTIKDCDEILEFKNGKLINKGKYEDLIKNSRSFQEIAKNVK